MATLPSNFATVWHLRILTGLWDDPKLGYTYVEAWPLLLRAADRELVRLTVGDIATCDWQAQVLHLTSTASQALARAVSSSRRSVPGSLNHALGWEVQVQAAFSHRAYVVYLDETACFGGVFLDAMSQMAVRYPVMRCLHAPGAPLRISILPFQIPFVEADPVGSDPVAPGHAAAGLAPLPGWRKWVAGLAATDTAVDMRRRIRDPRVRALCDEAGKLR